MVDELKINMAKMYIDEDIKKSVLEVLESGMFVGGEKSKQFEADFAKFIGSKYATSTSSGTTAITTELIAIGIRPGDEVIVPSFTFIASVSPILELGATPIFADIDPDTFCIDINDAKRKITEKTTHQ